MAQDDQELEEAEFVDEDEDTDTLIIFAGTGYEHVPDASYYEVEDRLSKLSTQIPMVYNERVKAFIDYFTVRDRSYTREVLTKKHLYFPIFEQYLALYNMPDEIKYLSIIESGFRVNARSRVGAVGLWQFMPATGRLYGLHQDWYVDDRMDPYKSTEAACRYLKALHGMFDDWELALAAYNCGPGNVRKAMRRSGKKHFWDIYPYLPRETRSYVPQFVAMTYVMNHTEEHNFYLEFEEYIQALDYDTIHVNHFVNLETLADQLNLCVEELEQLNPSIKQKALPGNKKAHVLRIPYDAHEHLLENRLAILDSAAKSGKEQIDYLARNSTGNAYGKERMVYTVRSGDVLGSIAQRHGVSVSDLRSWNNINGNLIRVGQKINVWQPASQIAKSQPSKPSPPLIINGQKYHVVQSGDTLWDISKKYENLTIDRIRQLNNLPDNKIKPGQKLIVG
ncbi:MAG: LysM peptidoglycan-binding domain-containing protein [Cyclobacteriaceae bacterium]